ncbi:undecaprenyl-diphosphate phosphatase [Desulfobotulus sp. H1]|uniref:Undecaprenyl-diphosphatase n=1 Tax=Desulfobotulus pelophilus TaxID=2823377 RepID=A0ABT3NAU9_9BACT|nr:undecaprenyl-diphosphate phosphatase [Desulfobotulus pelophilus]MCW7754097.1 undecaprenyl-diphosphate phosphatase [Desulfobotulus pelophilus]
MGAAEIIFLSLIQGLTEFLPISSSAHLILPAALLGWEDQGLAFDIAVHTGTLLAVIIYFQDDIRQLFHGWVNSFSGNMTTYGKMAWFLILATIPAGLAGLLAGGFIETTLRSAAVIAGTTLIFGALLWLADVRGQKKLAMEGMNLKQAMIIGLAQAVSLIPGTSRSGITITAGLMLGFDRKSAARFSFLLSIPIITLITLYQGYKLVREPAIYDIAALLSGAALSFVSALLCIHFFLKIIEKMGLLPFVLYRFALGIGLCLFLFF